MVLLGSGVGSAVVPFHTAQGPGEEVEIELWLFELLKGHYINSTH